MASCDPWIKVQDQPGRPAIFFDFAFMYVYACSLSSEKCLRDNPPKHEGRWLRDRAVGTGDSRCGPPPHLGQFLAIQFFSAHISAPYSKTHYTIIISSLHLFELGPPILAINLTWFAVILAALSAIRSMWSQKVILESTNTTRYLTAGLVSPHLPLSEE